MPTWADNPLVFGLGAIIAATILAGLYWRDPRFRLKYRSDADFRSSEVRGRGEAWARAQRVPDDAHWGDPTGLGWLGLFLRFFDIGFRFILSSYLLWLDFHKSRVWKVVITLIFLAMPFGVGVAVWWVWAALRGLGGQNTL